MILLLMMATGISSCINEKYDIEESELIDPEKALLVLRVNTVTRSTRADVADVEKINSLRIVLYDKSTETVEINQLFPDVRNLDFYSGWSSEYEAMFIIPDVSPGEKEIFIFANEESVRNLSADVGGGTFPSLSNFFSWATVGSKGFSGYVKTVKFSLNQDFINQYGLPYSSSYEITLGAGKRHEERFYLVPVATKFRFNFYNYQNQQVTLNSVSFSSVADNEFLMAHVEGEDIYKSLPNKSEKLYWIDWLHEISEISWNYGEPVWNEWFNGEYGWISDYNIPKNTNIPNNTGHTKKEIEPYLPIPPISADNVKPVVIGPYYYNESKNIISQESQNYNIEIEFHTQQQVYVSDPDNPNNKYWTYYPRFRKDIEDLHSLFRNTFVDIDIIMSAYGNISIDYTVCPWNPKNTTINFN